MSDNIIVGNITVTNICFYFNKTECAFECYWLELQNHTENSNSCTEYSIDEIFPQCLPDKTRVY